MMKGTLRRFVGPPREPFCIYRNNLVALVFVRLWDAAFVPSFFVFLAIFLGSRIIAAAVSGTLHSSEPGSIGLSRDYSEIAIAFLMAAHAAHIIRQWRRLSRLPVILRAAGLISRRGVTDGQFEAILK